MAEVCPKCNGSGFLGQIRGGGETERVPCDCNPRFPWSRWLRGKEPIDQDTTVREWLTERYPNLPQDAPASPDPSATPTQPPTIEPVPDFAANLTILKLQRIAPDYAYQLLTVLDDSGVEHQIFVSTEETN